VENSAINRILKIVLVVEFVFGGLVLAGTTWWVATPNTEDLPSKNPLSVGALADSLPEEFSTAFRSKDHGLINRSSSSVVSLPLRSVPSSKLSARSRLVACSSKIFSSIVPASTIR